jgi:hypothetical protein
LRRCPNGSDNRKGSDDEQAYEKHGANIVSLKDAGVLAQSDSVAVKTGPNGY